MYQFEVSRFTRYEAMNGGAKYRKWGGFNRSEPINVSGYRPLSAFKTWEINDILKLVADTALR